MKLRLGVINGFGQQKGVDGKIITDLTELSRNRAFADAVLLGGGEDLRLGVELAQEYGTRVQLLTIEGSTSSPTLRQEADTMTVLPRGDLETFITVRSVMVSAPQVALQSSAVSQEAISGTHNAPLYPLTVTVQEFAGIAQEERSANPSEAFESRIDTEIMGHLAALAPAERDSLTAALKTGAGVPAEHDGQLLARTRTALGRVLTQPEKAQLRRAFKAQLEV